ncbi:MAG TPA: hypothetical protein VFK37_08160 [Bacillales bacterium]|nr:hypothetical protein [Bacillales bacterium]
MTDDEKQGKKTVKSEDHEGFWNERTNPKLARPEYDIQDIVQNDAKRQNEGPQR